MTSSLRAEHQRYRTIMALMNLCKVSVLPAPVCNLWAAGWWERVHSVFWQDKGVGKGCLCTPGRPSLPGPGSVCWGCVPSSCSRSRGSRTSVQGPWRASGPGPFPEQMHDVTRVDLESQAKTLQQPSWTAGTHRQPKTGHFHCLLIGVSLFSVINQLRISQKTFHQFLFDGEEKGVRGSFLYIFTLSKQCNGISLTF